MIWISVFLTMLPFSGDTKTTIFLSPSDSHTKQAAGKILSCQQFLKLVYTAIVVSSLSITYLHNVKGLGSNRTNTSYRKAQEILHSVIHATGCRLWNTSNCPGNPVANVVTKLVRACHFLLRCSAVEYKTVWIRHFKGCVRLSWLPEPEPNFQFQPETCSWARPGDVSLHDPTNC